MESVGHTRFLLGNIGSNFIRNFGMAVTRRILAEIFFNRRGDLMYTDLETLISVDIHIITISNIRVSKKSAFHFIFASRKSRK